jgi:hypothetical protein
MCLGPPETCLSTVWGITMRTCVRLMNSIVSFKQPGARLALAMLLIFGVGCSDRVAGLGAATPVSEAVPCGGDCPDGTTCAPIVDDNGELIFQCVDVHLRYCAPCLEDNDCIDDWMPNAGSVCVTYSDGSGSYCATDCSEHSDCPEESYCFVRPEDGRAVCMPDNGLCDCTEWAIDNEATTSCSVTNAQGTCGGVRSCTEDGLTQCDALTPAPESCNGIDDDCNGETDESFPEAGEVCDGEDGDLCNDGFMICADGALVCDEGPEGRAEICNGLDDNCDEIVDNISVMQPGDLQAGVCVGSEQICSGEEGWLEPDYTVIADYEVEEVTCDDIDNDCDGETDEPFSEGGLVTFTDLDGTPGLVKGNSCGVGSCGQGTVICSEDGSGLACDTASQVSMEVCDGVDNDCNGNIDDIASPPLALNQAGVCAGAIQVCNGSSGWAEPDYAAIVGYESVELTCDGLDNDCDGEVDEELDAPDANLTSGVCLGSLKVCAGSTGWQEPDYFAIAGYETGELSCDGLDNDCDAEIDENLMAPAAVLQSGVCVGSVKVCSGAAGWLEPNYGAIAGYETTEVTCDGLDNDCNAFIDDGLQSPLADNQVGVCAGAVKLCNGVSGWAEPDYSVMNQYQAFEALCDELDNDCDGDVDEPFKAGGTVTVSNTDGTPGLVKGNTCGLGDCLGGTVVCSPDGISLVCSSADLASAEICDGDDNNCNGVTDDDLTPPLNTNQSGLCFGTDQVCTGASGWVDDYSPVAGYGLYEEPDGSYLDENCDGIDGDILWAVFVAPTGTDNGICDFGSPCLTLNHAFIAASNRGLSDVYVQAGEYAETLTLVDGLRVFGGYDSLWARDQRILDGHMSTLIGDSDASGYAVAVSANSVAGYMEGMIIRAPDGKGTGESSYGVHGVSSTLTFERITFMQGDGAPGYPGNNGQNASGSAAQGGGNGGGADEYTTTCNDSSRGGGGSAGSNGACSGTGGGNGGRGGTMDSDCGFWTLNYNARSGDSGNNAVIYAGGSVGYRGNGGGTCGTGGAANDGWIQNGVGGSGGSAGVLAGYYWVANTGSTGGLGSNGTGGGGGGGSGGCDDGIDSYGAGGGGGGAGGCAAPSAASGGGGGGASLGVFTVNSTLVVKTSDFVRGAAGDGGSGGLGGRGQSGGSGGSGGSADGDSKRGGDGGSGAHGGHGGGGGGGAGGLCYGIFTSSSDVLSSGNTFEAGAAGSGGAGGDSATSAPVGERDGNPGSNGVGGVVGEVGVAP